MILPPDDEPTGKTKPLLDVGGYFMGISVGVSHDDRWITCTETASGGDVWIGELHRAGSNGGRAR